LIKPIGRGTAARFEEIDLLGLPPSPDWSFKDFKGIPFCLD
jgi:hypothetical protein